MEGTISPVQEYPRLRDQAPTGGTKQNIARVHYVSKVKDTAVRNGRYSKIEDKTIKYWD